MWTYSHSNNQNKQFWAKKLSESSWGLLCCLSHSLLLCWVSLCQVSIAECHCVACCYAQCLVAFLNCDTECHYTECLILQMLCWVSLSCWVSWWQNAYLRMTVWGAQTSIKCARLIYRWNNALCKFSAIIEGTTKKVFKAFEYNLHKINLGKYWLVIFCIIIACNIL